MNLSTRTTAILTKTPLILILFSPAALAWPGCGAIFTDTYSHIPSETETLGECQTCHQDAGGGGNFNPYGDDLLANGASGANGACTNIDLPAALAAVEGLDSDMEGNSNIAEIEASTQPGWCVAGGSVGCSNSSGAPAIPLDPQALPSNTPPVADAGGPYEGEAGSTAIQFNGSGSSDSDGDSLTYAWDFGDQNSGTGAMPTHIYVEAGNYEVRLIVNDGQADSDPSVTSASITAPPMNVAPIADPGGPYEGEPGAPVMFDGSASSDPNGDVLTYAWDFGNGSFGDGISATHTFVAEGTYSITLTVNDGQVSDSATTSATIVMPPANRTPTADPGGPYSGNAGSPISFDGSASSDPDEDTLTYRWDFGDGTLGDGAMPTHTFSVAGNYTITLIVNDGEFDSDAMRTEASISDATLRSDGEALYTANCEACHGHPWATPAVDESLPGLRRVGGARSCNIEGSIFGTSVFPNGVTEMQYLQGLSGDEIELLAEYLNSNDTSGEQRYVTSCAGCHGDGGSGGRVDEDVHGDSAHETFEAIADEEEMYFLACMPSSDIEVIADYLAQFDDDYDDDGIADDEDDDDDNDGIHDDDDADDDNDGVGDDDEREDGTDPRDHDTDDDGLNDGEERDHGTDPNDHDSDDDGVSDGDEVKVFNTNPLVADSVSSGNSGGGSIRLPLLLLLLSATMLRRLRD